MYIISYGLCIIKKRPHICACLFTFTYTNTYNKISSSSKYNYLKIQNLVKLKELAKLHILEHHSLIPRVLNECKMTSSFTVRASYGLVRTKKWNCFATQSLHNIKEELEILVHLSLAYSWTKVSVGSWYHFWEKSVSMPRSL